MNSPRTASSFFAMLMYACADESANVTSACPIHCPPAGGGIDPPGHVVFANRSPRVGHHTPRPSSTSTTGPFRSAATVRAAVVAAGQLAGSRSPHKTTGLGIGEGVGDRVGVGLGAGAHPTTASAARRATTRVTAKERRPGSRGGCAGGRRCGSEGLESLSVPQCHRLATGSDGEHVGVAANEFDAFGIVTSDSVRKAIQRR